MKSILFSFVCVSVLFPSMASSATLTFCVIWFSFMLLLSGAANIQENAAVLSGATARTDSKSSCKLLSSGGSVR